MKLVFIDAQNKSIRVIDSEVREYSWSAIEEVRADISGSNVLYITSLELAKGDDVVQLILSQLGENYIPNSNVVTQNKTVSTGRKFLRTKKPGKIIVPHKDGESSPLAFENMIDFKPYSDDLFETFPGLKRYIELTLIEIVDEGYIASIKKEYNKNVTSKNIEKQNAKDKYLESILVKDTAKKTIGKIEDGGYDDASYEMLDITDDVNSEKADLASEEFYRTAKDAGIDIAGVDQ